MSAITAMGGSVKPSRQTSVRPYKPTVWLSGVLV